MFSPVRSRPRGWGAPMPAPLELPMLYQAVNLVLQSLSLRGSPHTPPELVQRWVLLLFGHVAWLPAMVNRSWYDRNQMRLFTLVKVVIYSQPIAARDHGVQRVMRAEATPGLAGAAVDLLRFLLGAPPLLRSMELQGSLLGRLP